MNAWDLKHIRPLVRAYLEDNPGPTVSDSVIEEFCLSHGADRLRLSGYRLMWCISHSLREMNFVRRSATGHSWDKSTTPPEQWIRKQ